MLNSAILASLGWSADFMQQLDLSEIEDTAPYRITALHRSRIEARGEAGEASFAADPNMPVGDLAVGDWVLTKDQRVLRRLERRSTLARRAAGHGGELQLIAANLDTLFIVTSCNADFNPARLERYLALAVSAGVQPVILLTKVDQCEAPETYIAQAQALSRGLVVIALDARHEDVRGVLADWAGNGHTVALLGSSGVGKSTLANALSGADLATGGIREDDAKGRHTTTNRQMIALPAGGWLIDTPGIRELRLADAQDGVNAVFDDIAELAAACRFSDCNHQAEPGCAVTAAIKAGTLDPDRLRRWGKLRGEDRHYAETAPEARQRGKAFGKTVRDAMNHKRRRRDRNYDA